jgi:hypothetical protein
VRVREGRGIAMVINRRRRFGPYGYVFKPARAFLDGPELDTSCPFIHNGFHYRCPMCSADWEGRPIGHEEITSKELARRSGLSQRRIDRLVSDYHIAAHPGRPPRIPILRSVGEPDRTPDNYVWCPLCGAVWASGRVWEGFGSTPKEISEAYCISVQHVYQLIRRGELRVLPLRTQGWWSPPWEVLALARRKHWPEDTGPIDLA